MKRNSGPKWPDYSAAFVRPGSHATYLGVEVHIPEARVAADLLAAEVGEGGEGGGI